MLSHILRNKEGLRVAVLVNDMAEVNIDEALVSAKVQVAAGEQLVALSNGCICCNIREDLIREIRSLAEKKAFDYLVVESTGISLPLPVAASFGFPDESGATLEDCARLDTNVTVVDAERFVRDVMAAESLQERGMAVDDEDDRTVADLLVEQVRFGAACERDVCRCDCRKPQRGIHAWYVRLTTMHLHMQVEFADVLVLNKCDLVSSEQQAQLIGLLRTLNPSAEVREMLVVWHVSMCSVH